MASTSATPMGKPAGRMPSAWLRWRRWEGATGRRTPCASPRADSRARSLAGHRGLAATPPARRPPQQRRRRRAQGLAQLAGAARCAAHASFTGSGWPTEGPWARARGPLGIVALSEGSGNRTGQRTRARHATASMRPAALAACRYATRGQPGDRGASQGTRDDAGDAPCRAGHAAATQASGQVIRAALGSGAPSLRDGKFAPPSMSQRGIAQRERPGARGHGAGTRAHRGVNSGECWTRPGWRQRAASERLPSA